MKIETKFEPEQYVFYIDKFVDENGKEYYSIVADYIRRIFINSLKEVYYVLNDEQTFIESELFATREEAEQKLEEMKQNGR